PVVTLMRPSRARVRKFNDPRSCDVAQVPRSRHLVLHFRESVWTYPASLKYLAPKFLLYSEKSTELFGRSTDDRSESFCIEFIANLRVRKDLIHHTVELINYGDRSSGWRHDSEPRSVFESSKVNAAFAERRNVWKFGDTLATGDCEGAELPRLHLRCRRAQTQEN